MTPRQIDVARHALGLKRGCTVSYRNSFCASPGHADYDDWLEMVAAGHAIKLDGSIMPFGGDDLFRVTRSGADLAQRSGETVPGPLPWSTNPRFTRRP